MVSRASWCFRGHGCGSCRVLSATVSIRVCPRNLPGPDLPGATPWRIPWGPWSLRCSAVELLSTKPPQGVWSALHKQGLFCVGDRCDTRSSDQQEGNAAGAQPQAWPLFGAALLPSAQIPLLGPLCSTCLPAGLLGRELAFSLLLSLLSSLSSLLSSSSFLCLSLPFSFLFFLFFFFCFYLHPSLGAAFNVKTLL